MPLNSQSFCGPSRSASVRAFAPEVRAARRRTFPGAIDEGSTRIRMLRRRGITTATATTADRQLREVRMTIRRSMLSRRTVRAFATTSTPFS